MVFGRATKANKQADKTEQRNPK